MCCFGARTQRESFRVLEFPSNRGGVMERGAPCLLTLVDWLDEGFSSIIDLSAIAEPSKSHLDYVEGEEVEARCPLFKGLFRARIIAISGDRRKLKSIQVKLGACPSISSFHQWMGSWSRREKTNYWRPRHGYPLGNTWCSARAASRGKNNRRGHVEAEEDLTEVLNSVFTLNKEHLHSRGSKPPVLVTPTFVQEDGGCGSPPSLSPTSSANHWNSPEECKAPLTPALIESPVCLSDASEEPTTAAPAAKEPQSKGQAPKGLSLPPPPPHENKIVLSPSQCRRPECEILCRELEALRDQCAKLQAHNVMLQQQLNTAYADQNRRQHQELNDGVPRPHAGLFDDPAVPLCHGMIELVLGTGVYLYESQLTLARSSARSQTALARLLLDVFFTREEQAKSNLSGENGLQCLNPTVVGTIVAYSISQEQYQPSSTAVIKNSLRNKLGCLRAPSRLLHSARNRSLVT